MKSNNDIRVRIRTASIILKIEIKNDIFDSNIRYEILFLINFRMVLKQIF